MLSLDSFAMLIIGGYMYLHRVTKQPFVGFPLWELSS